MDTTYFEYYAELDAMELDALYENFGFKGDELV